jgi:hypothetical protein
MLWIFLPEKSNSFGRVRTRDLGYQRVMCVLINQKYNFTLLDTIITSSFHRYTQLWLYAAVVLLTMGANST